MGDLIFTDFKSKDGSYSSSPNSDLEDLMLTHAGRVRADDTAPCELPPVQPMYVAPERDGG